MPPIPKPFASQSISDWIAQLQNDDSADQRLRALQAIGLLGAPDEIACSAAHALRDNDSTIRAMAAKLVGGLRLTLSDETETLVASLLQDHDPDTRFESARALLRTKSSRSELVAPILFSFLDEEETQPLMVASILNTFVEADGIPRRFESELLPRLLRFLDHDRAEVREANSAVFAKWPTLCESCTDQLLPLLDDSEPVVRENIALALGQSRINSEEVRDALRAASQDEDHEVARVAAEALQRLGQN
jgi:HEAT repeat protein